MPLRRACEVFLIELVMLRQNVLAIIDNLVAPLLSTFALLLLKPVWQYFSKKPLPKWGEQSAQVLIVFCLIVFLVTPLSRPQQPQDGTGISHDIDRPTQGTTDSEAQRQQRSNPPAQTEAQQGSVPPPPPPPPPPLPSRLDTLLAALKNWRSLGVKADPESLNLLRTVKDEDQAIFAGTNGSVWHEIKAAQDILNAPVSRLSAATLSRLPVFVTTAQQTELDLKLTQKVIDRLVDVGFKKSADEQHAAVIFILGKHKFDDIPNYTSGVQEFWAERVTLVAYAMFNSNSEDLFPEFSVTGYAEGSTEISRDKLAGCALLDAGLNATDKFIEMIGAKSRPFREKC
jgi:hypothetical protein